MIYVTNYIPYTCQYNILKWQNKVTKSQIVNYCPDYTTEFFMIIFQMWCYTF